MSIKWDYKVVCLTGNWQTREAELKAFGQDEWELVSVEPSSYGSLAYLKKAIPQVKEHRPDPLANVQLHAVAMSRAMTSQSDDLLSSVDH